MYESSRKILALFVSCILFYSHPLITTNTRYAFAVVKYLRWVWSLVFPIPSLLVGYLQNCHRLLDERSHYLATNEPVAGVTICADADPMDGSHWTVFFWLTILISEGILCCLAAYKLWTHRKEEGSVLMKQLTRESVLYFITYVSLPQCDTFWKSYPSQVSSASILPTYPSGSTTG